MRKQTKLVAVASAAALLAIGASMTSFAATGWVEEDGVWYYYDKDGNRVEDEWKKSGDNWYWLDSEEDGSMATSKLIDDDGDIYYVDANGVMVTNTWVKVVNEDQDNDNDPAEYRYYYMQSNGKAYKASESGNTKTRTIDGKRYAFDADGKMLYGWVNESSELVNDQSGWMNASYYFGGWEDGAMKTGWQKINVFDAYGDEDDDADKWFYFKSNGKVFKNEDAGEEYATKKINGKTYGFDEYGVMIYEWNTATGENASASNWSYFRSPEDGARVTKGWFKVVPDEDFDQENYDDENEKWYYANGDGTLETSVIKKINGKYYAFDENGAMLSGLVALVVDGGDIRAVVDDEVDSDDLDNIIDGTHNDWVTGANLYYFGSADNADNDGAMKTGNTTINLDGDNYSFHFATNGGADTRGAGSNGLVKKVYYKFGKKMAASAEDKYRAVTITEDDIVSMAVSKDIRRQAVSEAVLKSDGTPTGDTVRVVDLTDREYYLLGSNGSLKTKANGVKDADEWYFYSDADGKILYYTNSKDFSKTQTYKDWKAGE